MSTAVVIGDPCHVGRAIARLLRVDGSGVTLTGRERGHLPADREETCFVRADRAIGPHSPSRPVGEYAATVPASVRALLADPPEEAFAGWFLYTAEDVSAHRDDP